MVSGKPFGVVAAGVCLSAVLAVSGCAQQSASTETSQVDANRQYMSDVTQTVDELSGKLDSFVDAVSRNDTVAMQTQSENALQLIDEITSIEAPDDLSELKEGYDQACTDLKQALTDYVDLAVDVVEEGSSFDFDTYSEKLSSIQDEYNNALTKLKETDEKATELE